MSHMICAVHTHRLDQDDCISLFDLSCPLYWVGCPSLFSSFILIFKMWLTFKMFFSVHSVKFIYTIIWIWSSEFEWEILKRKLFRIFLSVFVDRINTSFVCHATLCDGLFFFTFFLIIIPLKLFFFLLLGCGNLAQPNCWSSENWSEHFAGK